MELRHLRHFVAVAETLNFARAAQRLGMEQSPLSHSIRNLEAELDVALFHRTTRRTWLTRAGSRLLEDSRRILTDVEAAMAAARAGYRDTLSGLRLGLSDHAAGEPFTRLLYQLEHQHPPISVDVRELTTDEATRQIIDGGLDAAVVLEQSNVAGIKRVRAWSEPLVVLAAIGDPIAERNELSLHELSGQSFVVAQPSTGPGFAGQVEALFSRFDVRPGRRTAVKHQNTMISFASTGKGLALLPASIALGLTTVAVLPITEAAAVVVSWFIYRDEEPSEPVAFALSIAALIDAGGPPPSEGAAVA